MVCFGDKDKELASVAIYCMFLAGQDLILDFCVALRGIGLYGIELIAMDLHGFVHGNDGKDDNDGRTLY